VTVDGERYVLFTVNFLANELHHRGLSARFRQDAATAHTVTINTQIMCRMHPRQTNSRHRPLSDHHGHWAFRRQLFFFFLSEGRCVRNTYCQQA